MSPPAVTRESKKHKTFDSGEARHLCTPQLFYYGRLPTVVQRENTLSLLYQKLQANKWIHGMVIFFFPIRLNQFF